MSNRAPGWKMGRTPSADEWASTFAGKVDADGGEASNLTATIRGGAIDGVPIGQTTPAPGNFSTLSINGNTVTLAPASAGIVTSDGTDLGVATLATGFVYSNGTLSLSGVPFTANNLSDVASPAAARANINQGMGTLVTSGATISTDAAANNAFAVPLTQGVGPYVLANPSNTKVGASYVWHIDQPGTTATTMTYGSNFLFGAPYSNSSPPPLSTLANGKSTLSCTVDAAGKLRCVMGGNDFA